MPGEAGGTEEVDTTQSVSPNEKTAPVVNGSNVETLPRGTGKQVCHLHILAAVVCFIEVVK
jgi:hypothetical protein